MRKTERVLVLFNATAPTTLNQDYTEELKLKDWETEADVIRALESLGHAYDLLGIYDNTSLIPEKIAQFQPTVIFNLVERFNNTSSHDRDVASYLRLLGIPFTGCGPTGLTLCKNKGLSKKILSFHKIRVPQFVILPRNRPVHRPQKLHFPIFIKPLKEEASLGISQDSFVENDQQFNERVRYIHESLGEDVIAEEYIAGRELYVSILGNHRTRVFPVRELKFSEVPEDEPKFASYKAKWDEAYRKKWGIRNQFAGSLANGTLPRLQKICKKIYGLLSIRGYGRIDLRLTPEGEIVFIEANPNPILSKEEDFAESAGKGEVPYPELIQSIINLSKNGVADD